MKKIKIFSVLLLVVSTVLFVGFALRKKIAADGVPPVVSCTNGARSVSVLVTEEELLQGVSAQDDRCGDVSDTLVVENISSFYDDGSRTVTYAAVDDSMNVGRCEQSITYTDYEEPKFNMENDLCFSVGGKIDFLSAISANGAIDGDLTERIKYSIYETVNTMSAGTYPIEFRVMDSAGNTVYLETEIEILEPEEARIVVELEKYLVYVKKGERFNPEKYYKDADVEDGNLRIKSKVDTSKSGIYHVDYIVESNEVSGKSRLIVVVE